MKAEVLINRFRCKYTKKVHTKDKIYEGTAERIKELQEKGWVGDVIEERNKDSFLDGNVEEVKKATEGLEVDAYQKLLSEEQEGKKRKGVIEHLEQMIESTTKPADGESE